MGPCPRFYLGPQVAQQEIQNNRPLDNSSIAKQPRLGAGGCGWGWLQGLQLIPKSFPSLPSSCSPVWLPEHTFRKVFFLQWSWDGVGWAV